MNADFRPSTPADAPAIAALCQRVLQVPAASPMFSAAQMSWKYWSARPGWTGSRSYVLTSPAGALLAHGAVIPLHFSRGGRSFTLLHLGDWAAEAAAVGAGTTLLRRIAGLADGLVILGGSALTRALVGPLGFRPLPAITRYAVATAAPPAAAGEAHALLRSASPADALLGPRPSTDEELVFEQTGASVEAFCRCPVVATEFRVVAKRGRPIGSFLLAFAAAQARIVDVWSGSSDAADWVALVRLARVAASERASVPVEVVALASGPPEEAAFVAADFSPCGTLPLHVLAARDVVPDQARVRVRMIDGDIAFLHHGTPERWGS